MATYRQFSDWYREVGKNPDHLAALEDIIHKDYVTKGYDKAHYNPYRHWNSLSPALRMTLAQRLVEKTGDNWSLPVYSGLPVESMFILSDGQNSVQEGLPIDESGMTLPQLPWAGKVMPDISFPSTAEEAGIVRFPTNVAHWAGEDVHINIGVNPDYEEALHANPETWEKLMQAVEEDLQEEKATQGKIYEMQGRFGSAKLPPANPRKSYYKQDYDALQTHELEELGRELLLALNEDPMRVGLRDTPRRFAKAWQEFMNYDPGTMDTTFETNLTDQMVIVGPMRLWSMCEHHLLPFFCDVTIGVVTQNKVLGLSKFARIAQKQAHKLQLQERLCADIVTDIQNTLGVEDVAVLGIGQHLCMTMRGIKMPSLMTTSVLRGCFLKEGPARQEFLTLAQAQNSRHASF